MICHNKAFNLFGSSHIGEMTYIGNGFQSPGCGNFDTNPINATHPVAEDNDAEKQECDAIAAPEAPNYGFHRKTPQRERFAQSSVNH